MLKVTHNKLNSAKEIAELFFEIKTSNEPCVYIIEHENFIYTQHSRIEINSNLDMLYKAHKNMGSNKFLIINFPIQQACVNKLTQLEYDDIVLINNSNYFSFRENNMFVD